MPSELSGFVLQRFVTIRFFIFSFVCFCYVYGCELYHVLKIFGVVSAYDEFNSLLDIYMMIMINKFSLAL
jgi:hypothetical protein